MEERPLIVFTLLLQAAAGAAWALAGWTGWLRGEPAAARALAAWGWPAIAGMAVAGVLASAAHLGVPANAWRAARNWRTSWLSREILAAAVFTGSALAAAIALHVDGCPPALGAVARAAAMLSGPALVHCMAKAYRLAPAPAWDTPLTPAGFFTTSLLLGGLASGAILISCPGLRAERAAQAWPPLAAGAVLLASLSLGLGGLWLARLPAAMKARIMARRRGLLLGRSGLALAGIGAAALTLLPGWPEPGLARAAAIAALAGSEWFGRTLFYTGLLPHGVYLYEG